MINSCPDSELDTISTNFVNFPSGADAIHSPAFKEQRIMLSIANLKRYLLTDGHILVKWAVSTLLERFLRIQKDIKEPFIPLEKALLNFLTSSLSFMEATNNSALGVLFEMVKGVYRQLPAQAIAIIGLVSDDIPKFVITDFHHYLITLLANTGNPITAMETKNAGGDEILLIKNFGCSVLNSLLHRHESLVRESVTDLLDSYLTLLDNNVKGERSSEWDDSMDDTKKYTLGYILALPVISDVLTNECWPEIFRKLYDNSRIGTLLLFERNTGYSRIRTASGELVKVVDIFNVWLSNVAFIPDGIIMKHALDIAVVVDTVVYDHRLNLQYLLPPDGKSIMDNFLPSLTNNGISPASIDLVDEWILPLLDPESNQQQGKLPRKSHQLKLPIFFLKLALLKDDTLETALNLLIKLMSHLPVTTMNTLDESTNTNRYLLHTMIETAEIKWPSSFSTMLEQLFSKAMTLNITGNDEDMSKVEIIFGNLAILSDDQHIDPTRTELSPTQLSLRQSFADYISSHCRQVMLLFMNHPSNTCRAMGYRVLSNSKFWQQDYVFQSTDISAVCKSLSDSWFRLLKTQYSLVSDGDGDGDSRNGTDEKQDICLMELQNLITQFCIHGTTSNTMTGTIIDSILYGDLETFPRTDLTIDSSSKTASLLGRITQDHFMTGTRFGPPQLGIPRYIPNIQVLKSDLNNKDSIYMANIERTANIFREASIKASDERRSLMTIINQKLPIASPLSLKLYDEALPYRIPYSHDITNGGAFKDHPALFLILDQCLTTVQDAWMPLVRSVFIYFITFWNMTEVAGKPSSLYFATQLEETMHLLHWMEWMLPDKLRNIGTLLPYLSGSDVGAILYNVIWPYTRPYYDSSSSITTQESATGISTPELDQSMQELVTIYEQRKLALAGSQSWTAALMKIAMDLDLVPRQDGMDANKDDTVG